MRLVILIDSLPDAAVLKRLYSCESYLVVSKHVTSAEVIVKHRGSSCSKLLFCALIFLAERSKHRNYEGDSECSACIEKVSVKDSVASIFLLESPCTHYESV